MTSYRYPNERLILALTLVLVFAVIVATAAATLCGSVLFVLAMLALSYFLNRSHHNRLIEKAHPITPQTEPELARLVADCGERLQSGSFRTFIASGRSLNAYTFGLVKPQVVVVYAGVLRIMDADELRFIIGHELGHVGLGHTWLNRRQGRAIVLWKSGESHLSADKNGDRLRCRAIRRRSAQGARPH
jgi:Zn-dependent protease with chaperone function